MIAWLILLIIEIYNTIAWAICVWRTGTLCEQSHGRWLLLRAKKSRKKLCAIQTSLKEGSPLVGAEHRSMKTFCNPNNQQSDNQGQSIVREITI